MGGDVAAAAALVEYIVGKLKTSSTGFMAASQLGSDINKKAAWAQVLARSGGLKAFCLEHADTIRWISEGSGRVELVNVTVDSVPADAVAASRPQVAVWGTCSCPDSVRL